MARDLHVNLFDDTLSPTCGLAPHGAKATKNPTTEMSQSDGDSWMYNAGTLLKLFAAAAIIMVLCLATATWFFFKRPLTLDAAFSRFALGQAGLSKRQVATEEGTVTLFEGGRGPTLILVHDAGEQAGSWARTVTPLIKENRVVVPDLAGHGSSDPAEGPISFNRLVDDFAAMIDDCCPDEPPTLVGHGFGARVVVEYAADHPGRVGPVVLVNGGPLAPDTTHINLFPSNRAEALQTMQSLMGTDATVIPGHVLDDIVRHAEFGPASRIEEPPRLPPQKRLKDSPLVVSLVWGAHDSLYDLEYASAVSELFNNAPVTRLEHCGHMPQRECPVRFVEALRATLTALDSPENSYFED